MSLIAPIRAAIFGVTLAPSDPSRALVPRVWSQFFQALADGVQSSSSRVGTFTATGQTATLGPTAIVTSPPTLTAGRYRINSYSQVMTAASVSSSLTISYGWTFGGVAQTETFAAMTGNTTATHQSLTAIVRIDDATAITYTATYVSVGTPMAYSLDVDVEQLP